MKITFGCVVEGHGEIESVRILITRIVGEINPCVQVHVPHPIRRPRSALLKAGELERAATLAARTAGALGAVLVLLDSDDDCPKQLGPELLRRAEAAAGGTPITVVLPKYEFEAWFLAAAESLRGLRGLREDLLAPDHPEAIRAAKEWLARHTVGEHGYHPRLDQPALTGRFDLNAARRSPSFDKLWRDLNRIVARITAGLRQS